MDDNQLWKLAKARVAFKAHLRKYLGVNALLWGIWLLVNIANKDGTWSFPWPIYVTLAWGIVVGLQFFKVYPRSPIDPVSKEFEKLKKKNDELLK